MLPYRSSILIRDADIINNCALSSSSGTSQGE